MPAQPTWFPRLTEILADLNGMENVPFIDRHAFERIFRVKDRRARVLMSRFAGTQVGNAWAVNRQQLIQSLKQIQQGVEFRGTSAGAKESPQSTNKPNADTPRGSPVLSQEIPGTARYRPCPPALTSALASCASGSHVWRTFSRSCLIWAKRCKTISVVFRIS